MGNCERRSLHNRFVRLIEHLLKWQHQSQRWGSSLAKTIMVLRRGIRRLPNENPSLRPGLAGVVAEAYVGAVAFVIA
jgi:hypothetical protein